MLMRRLCFLNTSAALVLRLLLTGDVLSVKDPDALSSSDLRTNSWLGCALSVQCSLPLAVDRLSDPENVAQVLGKRPLRHSPAGP
jgi:hypothetical protein